MLCAVHWIMLALVIVAVSPSRFCCFPISISVCWITAGSLFFCRLSLSWFSSWLLGRLLFRAFITFFLFFSSLCSFGYHAYLAAAPSLCNLNYLDSASTDHCLESRSYHLTPQIILPRILYTLALVFKPIIPIFKYPARDLIFKTNLYQTPRRRGIGNNS